MTDEQPEKREEPNEEELERRLRKILGEDESSDDHDSESEQVADEIELKLAEFDENVSEATRKAAENTAVDDEFNNRLDALEARARAVKATQHEQQKQINERRATDQSDARSLGLGLTIAYAIIGLPLLGAGIGWLIDNQLGSEGWKGLLALGGAVIGLVHAIYMLNRHNNRP